MVNNKIDNYEMKNFADVFWSLYTKKLYNEDATKIKFSGFLFMNSGMFIFNNKNVINILKKLDVIKTNEVDDEFIKEIGLYFRENTIRSSFRDIKVKNKWLDFDYVEQIDELGVKHLVTTGAQTLINMENINYILEYNEEEYKKLVEILVDQFIIMQGYDITCTFDNESKLIYTKN